MIEILISLCLVLAVLWLLRAVWRLFVSSLVVFWHGLLVLCQLLAGVYRFGFELGFWLVAGVFFNLLGLVFPTFAVASSEVPRCQRGILVDGLTGQPVGPEVVDEVVHAPLTAHLCARPRRRAVWVRRLEKVLGGVPGGTVGQFVRGRWTPDLPSPNRSQGLNLVLSARPDGVKILGGGSVRGKEETRVGYLVVEEFGGTVSVVFPELLAALRAYAFLRPRESTLVLALRSRALEWCKKRGLSDSSTTVAVEAAVSWAWVEDSRELRARDSITAPPTLPWWS